jgi:NAD(P)-dependent dehydrogenase (short-subunit alcohol dehydrogenase family)
MAESYPSFDLAGQVVLVTGAARGIGRATALACANAGADIALGLREKSTGESLIMEIEAMGRRAFAVQMDLLKIHEISAAADAVHRHFGSIDVLVNNAGLGPENLAENVTEADFDLTMDLNVKGTFFASQAVGRIMIDQGRGRIINLSSQAGSNVLPGESIYCTSKAAVNHMTRCLANEWARHGITVNAIAPTFVWTDATRSSLENAEFHRRTIAHIPLGRIGEPHDVTGAVVFLASPAASMITGTTLLVDGGWSVA